jgi:hypothetical protein
VLHALLTRLYELSLQELTKFYLLWGGFASIRAKFEMIQSVINEFWGL